MGLAFLNFVEIYREETPANVNWSHSGSLKGRKSDFRESHESVDTYLFGKMLFTASKTVTMGLRYPSTKMAIPAPLKKRFDN